MAATGASQEDGVELSGDCGGERGRVEKMGMLLDLLGGFFDYVLGCYGARD